MRCWALLAAALLLLQVDAAPLPPEVEAVQQYLLGGDDYPEDLGEHYRMKIENALIGDLDDDGRDEVVFQTFPHFRQSPTIVFFKLDAQRKVTRWKEGLAPGPMVKVDGEQLDSHTVGDGVDMTVPGMESDPDARLKIGRSALKHFGGVVLYRGFIHADGRKGRGSFIDLSALEPQPKGDNCEDFQFARLRGSAIGSLSGETGKLLAVWEGERIHLYRIRFIDGGFLDKQVEVIAAPQGFAGFAPRPTLGYSKQGEFVPLARAAARK